MTQKCLRVNAGAFLGRCKIFPSFTIGVLEDAVTVTAVRVKAESLQPIQQSTPVKLLRGADCYLQRGLKFPSCGIFHSYAELLHACLLEADPTVSAYVPQPFRFRIGKRLYTPDCYVVRAGNAYVFELKPRGEFDPALTTALTEFLAFHAMEFGVLANEAFYAREIEATNYLRILQVLVTARDIQTLEQERELHARFVIAETIPLNQITEQAECGNLSRIEIALFRLLFSGKLKADLASRPLSHKTEFFL